MNKFSRIIALIFALFATAASAQQLAGGEITYKCNASDSSYTVTVTLYAKCPSPSLPDNVALSIYSPSENAAKISSVLVKSGADETLAACIGQATKCNGGTGETADAIVRRSFTGKISLPRKRRDWTIEMQKGPRTTLNGLSGTPDLMLLRAVINNLDAKCNNSPTFKNAPPLFTAANQAVVYDPAVTDLDGDKLKFALIKPIVGGSSVAYTAPYSETQPIKTTGAFGFNASNGTMTYTPSSQGDMSVTAIQVTETRNNIIVGSVMREMYFQTLTAPVSPPKFNGSDTLTYCAGDLPINIFYTGISSNPNAKLNIIWNNPSDWSGNSTVTPGLGTASFQLSVSAPSSFTKKLDLTLIDDNCGNVRKTIVIKVNPRPNVTLTFTDKLVTCIDSKKGETLALRFPNANYEYEWSNGVKTSNNVVFAAGTYTVTVTDKTSKCRNSNFVQIRSDINFTYDKYCTDLTTAFYDVSGNPDKINPAKESWPLAGTKTRKWTFKDIKEATDTSKIGLHNFKTKGTYKVKLETSDGNPTCINAIEKDVVICGKPPVNFVIVDTCVETEQSDLKLRYEPIVDLKCGITDSRKVKYYIDGFFRTNANLLPPYETRMGIADSGKYTVKLVVQNDAGCKDSLTKKIFVRDKPKVTTSASNSFFYRCDKGFPDTSFTFTAKTELTDSLLIHKNQTLSVSRTDYADTTVFTTTRGRITVPFKIKQNKQSTINFSVRDGYGCTNDTVVVIKDPITPDMRLSKYYCYLNDTLKLEDMSYSNKRYEWGLKSAKWDMKDGKIDTTLGFVNHIYSLKSLDEAVIQLIVEDVTGCKDTTTTLDGKKDKIVYLSEPDTSQFQIKEPKACFSDTVRIFGIKDKYINSWYYRYKNDSSAIYNSPELVVINTDFGKSFPSNLDAFKFYESNKYEATTGIFYNEISSALNFEKDGFGQLIVPLKPAKVCHTEVKRNWKIVERLHYNLGDEYDHCYDSLKVLKAVLPANTKPTAVLDTASFKWLLFSPSNALLEEKMQVKGDSLNYAPAKTLFTEIATTRELYNAQGKYLPYKLNVSYTYLSDGLTCKDTASLKIANELVMAKIDTSPSVTCLNYTRSFYFRSPRFLENYKGVDELEASYWNFGDDSTVVDALPRRRYKKPQTYTITAKATNYYGCIAKDTFLLTIKPSPTANFTVDPVCFGKESILDASTSLPSEPSSRITDYYWFFSDKIYKQLNSPKIPGDTTEPDLDLVTLTKDTNKVSQLFTVSQKVGLVVRDENGCYDETEILTAVVNPKPETGMTAKTVENNDEDYLGNEPIKFTETKNDPIVTKWTWNMGDSVNVFTSKDLTFTYPYYAPPYPIEKNIYDVTLTVTTEGGCMASAKKRIDVNVYFVLPNAFSPNEDGLHDQLLGVGKGIKEMKEFKIFNRWGEVVHSVTGKPEKDDSQRGYLLWDGKYKGEPQPVGAYVYYAVVKTGYGDELIFKGNLALLK